MTTGISKPIDKPVVVDVPARLMTVGKASGSPDVQMFDAAAINASIERNMNALQPGKKVAAIAYVDKDGANVAIVGKLPVKLGTASWTVLGIRKWSGDWNAAAALRWAI
jgi:hypothetical protein